MQLFLLALEPAYRFGWKAGADQLMMTSCGTGARRPRIEGHAFKGLPPGLRMPLTVSVGVACTSIATALPEVLLQAADTALYDAKRNGRNRVEMARTAEAI